MGTFEKHVVLQGSPAAIGEIAEAIKREFSAEGFEVLATSMSNGGTDISITKGNLFKAVLGMKSALKVTLVPQGNGIAFDASVGIFGQQLIPSIISWFYLWPVLLTQIWGLVQQSKLDDKALEIAQRVLYTSSYSTPVSPAMAESTSAGKFCPNCGIALEGVTKFCPNCGTKLV